MGTDMPDEGEDFKIKKCKDEREQPPNRRVPMRHQYARERL